MTPARRAALIERATTHGSLIIEDDYDAEFRYDRAAVGAVQGLDPGRVAHVGSASKTLAPGVRLGWISAPPELVEPLREQKSATDSGSPALDQLALADLLHSGDYERHVLHARRAYRRRRDRLVRAIRTRLPELELSGTAAGMQLLLTLPDVVDDLALVDAASSRRINIAALAPMHLTPRPDAASCSATAASQSRASNKPSKRSPSRWPQRSAALDPGQAAPGRSPNPTPSTSGSDPAPDPDSDTIGTSPSARELRGLLRDKSDHRRDARFPRIPGNSSGRSQHNVRNPAVRKVGYSIEVRLVHRTAWVQVELAVSEIRVLPR